MGFNKNNDNNSFNSTISPELADKMQGILRSIVVKGSAGTNEVTVEIDGAAIVKAISIDESLLNPREKETLEHMLVAAYRDAHAKLQQELVDKISQFPELM